MEHDELLDSNIGEAFVVTETAKRYLIETAKWAKILAIVGFVFVGLLVIISLFAGTIMTSLLSTNPNAEDFAGMIGGGIITVFYLSIALFYFFPTLYLYRFSVRTSEAIRTLDNQILTEAFSQLKSCFKFLGIMMLAMLILYGGVLGINIVFGLFTPF